MTRKLLRAQVILCCLLPAMASAQAPTDRSARELSEALDNIDPSYSYHGLRSGHGSAVVGGSSYRRTPRQAVQREAQGPATPNRLQGANPGDDED